jgi:hypothetical protein
MQKEKECNKFDLTIAQCFVIGPIIMIRPSGLLLVVSHLLAIPILVSWVRLQNQLNFGIEKKYLLQATNLCLGCPPKYTSKFLPSQ